MNAQESTPEPTKPTEGYRRVETSLVNRQRLWAHFHQPLLHPKTFRGATGLAMTNAEKRSLQPGPHNLGLSCTDDIGSRKFTQPERVTTVLTSMNRGTRAKLCEHFGILNFWLIFVFCVQMHTFQSKADSRFFSIKSLAKLASTTGPLMRSA